MKFFIQHLLYFLMIGSVLIIAISWYVYASGLLNRFMDMIQRNTDRSLAVIEFGEDRQIRDRRFKIGKFSLLNMIRGHAYQLMHNLILISPKGGKKWMPVSTRDADPIDFHNRMTKEERDKYPTSHEVFLESTSDINESSARNAATDIMMQSVSILALVAGIVVVVMGIVVFITTKGQHSTTPPISGVH